MSARVESGGGKRDIDEGFAGSMRFKKAKSLGKQGSGKKPTRDLRKGGRKCGAGMSPSDGQTPKKFGFREKVTRSHRQKSIQRGRMDALGVGARKKHRSAKRHLGRADRRGVICVMDGEGGERGSIRGRKNKRGKKGTGNLWLLYYARALRGSGKR